MEKRAARLAPVVDMASKAERDAATQLGRCQQQLLAAQQKLAELEATATTTSSNGSARARRASAASG